MNELRLFKVMWVDDCADLTIAVCTTYEKAKKAKMIIAQKCHLSNLEIVQDERPVDTIEIAGNLIEL